MPPVNAAELRRRSDGSISGIWGPFEIRSAYQPIYAIRARQAVIAAYEGLMRPFQDDRPLQLGTFFPQVPESERNAVEALARRLHLLNARTCLAADASLFINFDPSLFAGGTERHDALRDMRRILVEVELRPERIVCEVTEQKSTSERVLADFVRALRGEGYRIAVDDYGAASSDSARIDSLKPDIVKFDADWVTRLMGTDAGYDLLRQMVRGFRRSGIETVFEGIEEPWQVELARKSGVTMVQGFGLARPQLAPTRFAAPEV